MSEMVKVKILKKKVYGPLKYLMFSPKLKWNSDCVLRHMHMHMHMHKALEFGGCEHVTYMSFLDSD